MSQVSPVFASLAGVFAVAEALGFRVYPRGGAPRRPPEASPSEHEIAALYAEHPYPHGRYDDREVTV